MAFTSAGAFSRKYAIKDLRSFLTILMLVLAACDEGGDTPVCQHRDADGYTPGILKSANFPGENEYNKR
jgi:hypothetical protein